MARFSASGNFCCMRRPLDWSCWRWGRSVSPSFITIFRGGAGVLSWIRRDSLHVSAATHRSLPESYCGGIMRAVPTAFHGRGIMRAVPVFLLLLTLATVRAAGPIDFGKAELDAAMAERKLKLHVDTELSLNPPETFSITLYKPGMVRITGGDLRGLMYGLIEASEQIRANGKLKAASGKPATAVRGVRMTLRSYDLTQPWFTSDAHWRAYFQTLARS